MTFIIPLKTPPQMLQPPSEKVVKGVLQGFKQFGFNEAGLTKMADMAAKMPDDAKALTLIEEIDHLVWLSTIWLHGDKLCAHVEFDASKPSESAPHWVAASIDKVQWVLLDRYRSIDVDAEVKDFLEANAVPF